MLEDGWTHNTGGLEYAPGGSQGIAEVSETWYCIETVEGWTVLHLASWNNDVVIIKFLLQVGAHV